MGMRLVRLRIEVGQREGKVGQREGSYSALSFKLYCHTHMCFKVSFVCAGL